MVEINVDVTVNGHRAEPPKPRRRGLGNAGLHEFYSADGMSRMDVTIRKGLANDPLLRIDVELMVKETPGSHWVPDLGSTKEIELDGELTDRIGRRWSVGGGTKQVPADEYTHSIVVHMHGQQDPPVRLEMWTVRKAGGYWGSAGPNSHLCEGVIHHQWG